MLPNGSRAPSSHAGKGKRQDRCPCAARTLDLSSMPTTRPKDPGGIPSVPFSKLGKRTSHSAPKRRPDAATSAMPPGSRRPSVAASRPSCCALHSHRRRRVRRVGMSPLFGTEEPARHPCSDPSAFQVICRCTEGHFRGAPQGSAEMLPLLRSGNPLRWIPGPFQ